LAQTAAIKPGTGLLILTLFIVLLASCASLSAPETSTAVETAVLPGPVLPTSTTQVGKTQQSADPTHSPIPLTTRVWISPDLPGSFREAIVLPASMLRVSQREMANLWVEAAADLQHGTKHSTRWVYALVAPFPTLVDGVSLQTLKKVWQGQANGPLASVPLLMTADTQRALASWWGMPGKEVVRVVEASAILESAWVEMPSWALIPFEEIEPRWKVLRVDGQSPLDKNFAPAEYPLALPIQLSGTEDALAAMPAVSLPANRDPQKLTVLAMTGVTALTRNFAIVMEEKGITYPLEEIGALLAEADLTHISNEVSFHEDCPKPAPGRGNQRFCSHPKYIELLETAGANIIELTGNHNMDWGPEPFLKSLDMYHQRGWQTYGGGANLDEAQKPAFITHNGNRLVFLGCSPAGPENVWAGSDWPGSAPCDINHLEQQVEQLRAKGYLPIVTFQAVETEGYMPSVAQGTPNFRRMARAGAVIVSGSQSHFPQPMTFINDSFIHYGLGNLFFDQMNLLETRQGFIDRHVFYNGKYLGVELLTTLMEQIAQPRAMTPTERENLLEIIFALSNWHEK
jgi:hypothetical protein